MTIRNDERGWKTLGRKRAEVFVWKLYHAIRAGKMEDSSFSKQLKDEVRLHHGSLIVKPMEEMLEEICTTYKIKNPLSQEDN